MITNQQSNNAKTAGANNTAFRKNQKLITTANYMRIYFQPLFLIVKFLKIKGVGLTYYYYRKLLFSQTNFIS